MLGKPSQSESVQPGLGKAPRKQWSRRFSRRIGCIMFRQVRFMNRTHGSSTTWSARPRQHGNAERPFRRSKKRLRKSETRRGFTTRDPRGHSNPDRRIRVECETIAFKGDDGRNSLRLESTPCVSEAARKLHRKPAGFHLRVQRTRTDIRMSEHRPGRMLPSWSVANGSAKELRFSTGSRQPTA